MVVDKNIVNLLVVFVGDFKFVYSLTGGLGSCRKIPRIYRATLLVHMYKFCSHLKTVGAPSCSFSSGMLPLRSKILELHGK